MKKAKVFVHGTFAGILEEVEANKAYNFSYLDNYTGLQVSLTMPTNKKIYSFDTFPPFFDGLLPEGFLLEGLLKTNKIDRNDCFSQLIAIGSDMVGCITVEKYNE